MLFLKNRVYLTANGELLLQLLFSPSTLRPWLTDILDTLIDGILLNQLKLAVQRNILVSKFKYFINLLELTSRGLYKDQFQLVQLIMTLVYKEIQNKSKTAIIDIRADVNRFHFSLLEKFYLQRLRLALNLGTADKAVAGMLDSSGKPMDTVFIKDLKAYEGIFGNNNPIFSREWRAPEGQDTSTQNIYLQHDYVHVPYSDEAYWANKKSSDFPMDPHLLLSALQSQSVPDTQFSNSGFMFQLVLIKNLLNRLKLKMLGNYKVPLTKDYLEHFSSCHMENNENTLLVGVSSKFVIKNIKDNATTQFYKPLALQDSNGYLELIYNCQIDGKFFIPEWNSQHIHTIGGTEKQIIIINHKS